MPELGNRPAGCDDRDGAEKAADQRGVGRAEERGACPGDNRAETIRSLRKHSQKTGRSPAHVVRCQDLHGGAANRDAGRVADAETGEGDESHPKPWSQAEKSQAKGERQGGKNRKSALAFDVPGCQNQRRADHGADGWRRIEHAQAAGPDAVNGVGENGQYRPVEAEQHREEIQDEQRENDACVPEKFEAFDQAAPADSSSLALGLSRGADEQDRATDGASNAASVK